MPTLTELFKTKQLPSQNGKTAEEAYDIQNSKDIRISSANALVSATGLAGANLLRKTLGVRGSETLLEQELVGTRIIRGLSMPVIYGSELTRLILRTTPVLNTIKDNLNGNQPAAGPTDVAVGGGFFGAVPTPTYVVNALTKGKVKDSTINTGLIQNRIKDLGLIKNSADGTDFGTFLNDINNGNLNNIGRQALGSVIKLGKEAIRKAILPGKTGKNRQSSGTVLKSNSLTGFTDESAKWWGVTSTNYGDNVDSKFKIPVGYGNHYQGALPIYLSSFFNPSFYFIYIKHPKNKKILFPDNKHAFFTTELKKICKNIKESIIMFQKKKFNNKIKIKSVINEKKI